MQVVVEGKQNQLSKTIKEEKFDLDKIKNALSKSNISSESDKKLLEIIGKFLIEYNDISKTENFDRLQRLKATLLTEKQYFNEYLAKYKATEYSDFIKSISNALIEQLSNKTNQSVKNGKNIEEVSILETLIIEELQNIFNEEKQKSDNKEDYSDVLELLNNARSELILRKKAFALTFKRLTLENKKLKLKNDSLQKKESKENKKYKKTKAEFEKTKKDFQEVVLANQRTSDFMLSFNSSINTYRVNLNNYYNKYLMFSKQFRYWPGMIEGYKRSIKQFTSNFSRAINLKVLYAAIRVKKFLVNNKLTRGVKYLYRRTLDSPLYIRANDTIRSISNFIFKDNWIIRNVLSIPKKIGRYVSSKLLALKAKLAGIALLGKTINFIKSAVKVLTVGFALVLGPLFNLVSFVLDKAISATFFLVKTTLSVAMSSISFVVKATTFIATKVIFPLIKPIYKTVKKALVDVASAIKVTFSAALFAFLATNQGAYTLGYISGYFYEIFRKKINRDHLINSIEEKFHEIKTEITTEIENSKAYKFYLKGKENLDKFISKGRFIVATLIGVASLAAVYIPKILNGINNVFEVFGLPIIKHPTATRSVVVGAKAAMAVNKTLYIRRASNLVKATYGTKILGAIGQIVMAAIAISAVSGAFMTGYTQEQAFNADDPKLTIKKRFRSIYGVSFSSFEKSGQKAIGFLSSKKDYLDVSPEELERITSTFTILNGEIELIEDLSDKLNNIRQLYEKHRDEDNGTLPGVFSMQNAFAPIVSQILTSNLFGSIALPDIPDFLKTNDSAWMANDGTMHGQYTRRQQLIDIGVLNLVLNFRKLLTNSYIDAYKKAESGDIGDLRALIGKIRTQDEDIRNSIDKFRFVLGRETTKLVDYASNSSVGSAEIDSYLGGLVNNRRYYASSARDRASAQYNLKGTTAHSGVSAQTTDNVLKLTAPTFIQSLVKSGNKMQFSNTESFNAFVARLRDPNNKYLFIDELFNIDENTNSVSIIQNDRARRVYYDFYGKNLVTLLDKLHFIPRMERELNKNTFTNSKLIMDTVKTYYYENRKHLYNGNLGLIALRLPPDAEFDLSMDRSKPVEILHGTILATLNQAVESLRESRANKMEEDIERLSTLVNNGFSKEKIKEKLDQLKQTEDDVKFILSTVIDVISEKELDQSQQQQ